MMAMAASLKWRLPTLRRKRHLKFVDFIDLRHEMRRTQEENNDDDLDYQNYYYSDSSLFPDLVMKSRAHRRIKSVLLKKILVQFSTYDVT